MTNKIIAFPISSKLYFNKISILKGCQQYLIFKVKRKKNEDIPLIKFPLRKNWFQLDRKTHLQSWPKYFSNILYKVCREKIQLT